MRVSPKTESRKDAKESTAGSILMDSTLFLTPREPDPVFMSNQRCCAHSYRIHWGNSIRYCVFSTSTLGHYPLKLGEPSSLTIMTLNVEDCWVEMSLPFFSFVVTFPFSPFACCPSLRQSSCGIPLVRAFWVLSFASRPPCSSLCL